MQCNELELRNIQERVRDRMQRGEITAAQGNVEIVRARRVLLVRGPLLNTVRKALNDAVKRGELGHMKKDGHKPEAYYHPTFEYLAIGERKAAEDQVAEAVKRVAGWPSA